VSAVTNGPRRFTATITASGARALVELPFDPDEAWGAKERHYVAGTVGGRGIRGALDRTGLGAVLSLGAAWRRDNGVGPGDTVEVTLAPEEPLLESQADDVRAALEAEPAAAATFRSVAPFYRKNFLRWIAEAKRAETRAARIAETVKALAAGRVER
jgi:hypothetical protein